MKWILALGIGVATFASFAVPPAKGFNDPDLARIIFFHLPCAISTPLFLFFASYCSVRYLKTREHHWEVRASSAHAVGYVLALLTMITGMLFSRVQWGAWWQWDPRQTSFLLVLLLYAAYFALRAAYSDEQRRAVNSAAYSAMAAIPAFFLIFVFPRLPQVFSAHPSNTIVSGGLDRQYSTVFYTLFILILVVCAWIYRLSVRAGLLEHRVREIYGNLETRSGGAAHSGVVRPIPLSEDSGASNPVS